MSIIDMPLEELKKYRGISPIPADFDAFWDSALDEIKVLNPEIKLVKSEFSLLNFDCFDLYFKSVKNATIHAKVIKPSNKKDLPIVLHFHGYTGRSYDWIEYISFAAAGFCVFAMDCRGQAGESDDTSVVVGNTQRGHIIRGLSSGPKNLLFRDIFLDTAMLARVAQGFDFVDSKKISAFGGSQGGALTMACAGLVNDISLLAPVYPFLCDFKRVWKLNLQSEAYLELKQYFRMFDPNHKNEEDTFNTLSYIDIVNFARRIKGETFFAVALDDDVCPPSTTFAAYNNLKSKKDILIFHDFGHESLPGLYDIIIQKFQKHYYGERL